MNAEALKIIKAAEAGTWLMEPQAKELLLAYGLPVTRFVWARTKDEAFAGAEKIGYPLVAKIVSPDVVHKSDVGGIVVGVRDPKHLEEAFERLAKLPGFAGVLLDELASGVEIIVGAKVDPQFGTVILVGIGGTSVEVYKDVAIRMAPVSEKTAKEAILSLRGQKLIQGHRGADPVNIDALVKMIAQFSMAARELEDRYESIDLNPVLCSSRSCLIADARIMLR